MRREFRLELKRLTRFLSNRKKTGYTLLWSKLHILDSVVVFEVEDSGNSREKLNSFLLNVPNNILTENL